MFVSLFFYMGFVKKTAMLGLFFEMCLSIKWSFVLIRWIALPWFYHCAN